MSNMNAELLQTLQNGKQIVFKQWMMTTFQLYAQTNFHGQLKMTINKRKRPFSAFSSGFLKFFLWSDVELPRQAEFDRVEQFRYYM